MRWFRSIAGALLLAASLARASAADAPLAPFSADYQVLRNGKELGRATLTLRAMGNGNWEFSNQTQGTKGMASMLGLDVVEKSTFHWRDGLPEGAQYTYSQQAAIKSRQRSTDFDWNAREARTHDGKNDFVARLSGSAMDRNLVTVALMASLKRGARELAFPVVDKDSVTEQRFSAGTHESLTLPAGTFDTLRVERLRGEEAKRMTTSWFAPQRDYLPVQIEQVEKNGETITLRLAAQC